MCIYLHWNTEKRLQHLWYVSLHFHSLPLKQSLRENTEQTSEDVSHYECLYPLKEEELLGGKFKSNKTAWSALPYFLSCSLIKLFSYYTSSISNIFTIIIIFIPQQIQIIFAPQSNTNNKGKNVRLVRFHNNSTGLIISSWGHQLSWKPSSSFIVRHFMIISNT